MSDMQAIAAEAENEIAGQTIVEGTPSTGDGLPDKTGVVDNEGAQKTSESSQSDPLSILESLQGIDPKQKEALKAGYLRQADYTRKTQEISSDRNLVEEYKRYKPYIDKVLSDPNSTLYKQVFEDQAESEDGVEETQPYPQDPMEYAEWVKKSVLKEIEDNRDVESASNLDPRLANDQEFASLIAGQVAQDVDFVQGRKSATQATKDALDSHKRYIEKIRTDHRTELNKQVQNKRLVVPPGGTSVGVSQGKAQTMQEAAKMAEESLII